MLNFLKSHGRLVPAAHVLRAAPPYLPPHAGEDREGEDVDAHDNPRIKSGTGMTPESDAISSEQGLL
jgi:hypothetical protein